MCILCIRKAHTNTHRQTDRQTDTIVNLPRITLKIPQEYDAKKKMGKEGPKEKEKGKKVIHEEI